MVPRKKPDPVSISSLLKLIIERQWKQISRPQIIGIKTGWFGLWQWKQMEVNII